MKKIFILYILAASFTGACNNRHEYEINSGDKYEKEKASLEEIEKKAPAKFLHVTGNNKKNILGQTVIRGRVVNTAKVVVFKDIDVKLSFYSQTGTLLEEDHEVVYESIAPGEGTNFKTKYFAPKGTDSVGFHIAGAKF